MTETINQWRKGGNRSTWRKPLMMSFRKCHMLKPENSSPNRDSNHWWQARKADVQTVTPRVTPQHCTVSMPMFYTFLITFHSFMSLCVEVTLEHSENKAKSTINPFHAIVIIYHFCNVWICISRQTKTSDKEFSSGSPHFQD